MEIPFIMVESNGTPSKSDLQVILKSGNAPNDVVEDQDD
jgi:hypothetical protein